MLGNFQKAPYKSKIQFGSGWWFNDQRDGMENQLKALANLGMVADFVGMVTFQDFYNIIKNKISAKNA